MYDVSAKPQLYGPAGPYHAFAGRDASRALALGRHALSRPCSLHPPHAPSTDVRDAENGSLEGLSAEQEEALASWVHFFAKNYTVKGRLA